MDLGLPDLNNPGWQRHPDRTPHSYPHLADNPVRAGIVCLPLAALLFLIGGVLRGPFRAPALVADQMSLGRQLTSVPYSLGWLVILLAMALLLFGIIALSVDLMHGRSRAPVLFGLCASVVGVALAFAVAGSFAFAWPALGARIVAGDASAALALSASFSSLPTQIVAGLSTLLYLAGTLPLALAIQRSRVLPNWAGLLYLLHAPPLAIAATMLFSFEYVGAFFLLIAGIAIAYGVRHEEEVVRHLEHHRAAA
jgi:hypothetical protein